MFTIDKSLCLECGACVKVCPLGIFQRGEDGKVFARQKPCLDCFHCSAACPAKAVGHDALGREGCYPAPAENGLLARLQRRRSIRHFTQREPDRSLIRQALDGAAYAPSAKNQHACQWTAVLGREHVEHIRRLVLDLARDEPALRHLIQADRAGRDPITCGAPCLLFAHTPPDCRGPETDAVITAALADQLLADLGLGTCWGGYLRAATQLSPALRELLALPEGHQVHAVLMVGYSAERYHNIPPRSPASVTWVE